MPVGRSCQRVATGTVGAASVSDESMEKEGQAQEKWGDAKDKAGDIEDDVRDRL
jgi:uncharacterized protein YjbJ (UPF0337 family)